MIRYLFSVLIFIVGLPALTQSVAAAGQQPPATPATPSLGVYVYPKNNQTPAVQERDQRECYQWAKQETAIDPAAPPPPPPEAQKARGGGAKGAAAGAGGGALVGAITGDAGEGAAAGATVGAIRGRRQQRKANKQAEKQAEATGKKQQQQQLDTFRKAYSACLDGRGYAVK